MLYARLTKGDFDFLGFTFFNTKTRGGKYRAGIRTSKKKLKAKRQAAKALQTRLTKPEAQTMNHLSAALRGHCNTSGSARGSGQAFHDNKCLERSVETVYSTCCHGHHRKCGPISESVG
jgi:hypothetical protein